MDVYANLKRSTKSTGFVGEAKLRKEVSKLQGENKKLSAEASKLSETVEGLKKTVSTLESNISQLYDTAKLEISRKDRRVADLQKQIEDLKQSRNRGRGFVRGSRSGNSAVANSLGGATSKSNDFHHPVSTPSMQVTTGSTFRRLQSFKDPHMPSTHSKRAAPSSDRIIASHNDSYKRTCADFSMQSRPSHARDIPNRHSSSGRPRKPSPERYPSAPSRKHDQRSTRSRSRSRDASRPHPRHESQSERKRASSRREERR